MEKELEHHDVIQRQHVLKFINQLVALSPNLLWHQLLHPRHQHIFVVRSVEDGNHASSWGALMISPEKVVVEFLDARLLKGPNLASLRIYTLKHMFNRAVFTTRIDS